MKSLHRRAFIQRTMVGLPALSIRNLATASPNDQIQVAIIGVGG